MGTALQHQLACQFCHLTEKNGKPWKGIHGLHLHQSLCPENPERKKRRSRRIKANGAHRTTRVSVEPEVNGNRAAEEARFENHIAFLVGHCKTFIDVYAESHSLFGPAVTNRVGEVLFRATRRLALGSSYSMLGV